MLSAGVFHQMPLIRVYDDFARQQLRFSGDSAQFCARYAARRASAADAASAIAACYAAYDTPTTRCCR